MKHESFPRAARIGSGREIRRLLRRGRRCRAGPLDLFVEPTEGQPRVGLIVPRHGHKAVDRNRLRRRLRELMRREWLPVARSRGRRLDVLVRARKEAYGSSFGELRAMLMEAAERPCAL